MKVTRRPYPRDAQRGAPVVRDGDGLSCARRTNRLIPKREAGWIESYDRADAAQGYLLGASSSVVTDT